MSVVSKPLRRARIRSRSRSFYAAGAATLSIAAAVTAASAGVTEPAHAERPVATAHTEKADNPAADSANPAAFASASPKPTPAPAPVKVQPVAKPVIPVPPPAPVYPDNLDGWIRESLDILKDKNIPASYDGIYRNIMRESTGNPQAINLYDSNAAAGIPSKGLLQVIDPTFAAYHVEGTKFDVWDPVANIVAACNYAAHTYGSMDNVSSAY
ncbi:transglycosylase SLT domain-containing protein [Gordonia sp. ABSL11-1]|uniref:transglycosylase SLT domain-containing protein n=1 Tax=Gordonia sp. ABSL11-1 TaxID=3053924 RepID=UPI002573EE11|nr:transglycosylase SLT domain-containing protein [Gordonia sp. ABSL11-1]MDL9948355.1 transglycosylase SLT domain-containing protein [Gordonia sp. ABSL11-1]